MVGSFDITIRVKLDMDVTAQQAHDFVQEMTYSIKSYTDGVSVQDTEVIEDNIDEKDAEDHQDHKRGLYGEKS